VAQPAGRECQGCDFYVGQLASRQLELLRELVPKAVAVGLFVNPNAPANAEPQIRDLQVAANALGLQLHVFNVGSEGDAKTAFATSSAS
jgi:putative tryptophan/tyrosine transport system substrate-binding protein